MIRTVLVPMVVVMVGASIARAGEKLALESGAYEIRDSLELPNVLDMEASKVETHCLSADGRGARNHGFAVLSENNPLRSCPMTNIHEAGDTLTFDITCTGSNLAKAKASYLLMGDRFRGRIDMTMGGKNMTMTEVQEGRRTGACALPS